MRNPYESLAVSRTATADDIKKSFRQLAKKLHPDANKNDPDAAVRFAELNAAHKILSDKKKRRAFDRGEIDAEGKPIRRPAATRSRRYSEGQVAARVMFVAVMLATGSALIVHRLTAPSEIAASSNHGQTGMAQTERAVAPQSDSDALVSRAVTISAPTNQEAIDLAAESQRDRERIELLIAHSRRLISEGDVESARALLEHAAASRDPRAALDLGSTYDPFMLAILQLRGVAADTPLARTWYRRAIEYGSEEARKRLELLAEPRVRDAEPIVVARREIPRSVERGTAATAAVMAIAPAKPKSHILRLPNEVRTSRDERDQRCSVHCLLDATPPWLN